MLWTEENSVKSFKICAWFSSNGANVRQINIIMLLWHFSPLPANLLAIPQSIHMRKPLMTEQNTAAGGFVLHVWTGQN